jgi:hypothetical protein
MSIDFLFSIFHIISITGMCWIGWKQGKYLKKIINIPPIESYKNKIINFNSTIIINEDIFCNIVSAFTGISVGRMFWPICIPYSIWYIEKLHGTVIRKIIKDIHNN